MMSEIERIRQALHHPAYEDAVAERLGLNPSDLRVLDLVIAGPGLTPGRLVELTGLTSGAITGVLDRLESAGFVERRPDPHDRRSVTVQPVAARVADVEAARAPLHGALDSMLAGYGPEERAVIARFLEGAGGAAATESARLRATTRGGFVAGEYLAPLAGAERGRLVFASGAPRLSMNLAPFGPEAAARVIVETSASRLAFVGVAAPDILLRGSFDGPRPDVQTAAGLATIRYRRKTEAAFSSRAARLALNPTIPWSIELDGGLTDLTGSLAAVTLARLEVDGGANHVDLELPQPQGTAIVSIRGVVNSARFRRPAGVPVALRVDGGISRLRLDGERFERLAGERRFTSEAFASSESRYEIEVLGGASEIRVTA